MKQLDSDLWVTESEQRFLGLEVGARMTVIRLPGSELLLHSPVPASGALVDRVETLGEVRFLVCPNKLHHLYVGEWQTRFPEASTFVAPGLETKRSDITVTGVLGDQPEPGWKETVDQVFLEGFPFANEIVFFDRSSATLIATDLAFNMGASSPALTRLFFRLNGTYGRLAPTLFERMMVRDRAAFRRALERILEWPFERVVVSHGDVSEHGGREELTRAYQWVLGSG